jgi:hypothetical protein
MVAVIEAFNAGAVVECWQNKGNWWQPTDSPLWFDSCKYRIAKVKSPIAGGHNPDGLTEEIVGDGYRLLTTDEIEFVRGHAISDNDIQYWDVLNRKWFNDSFHYFDTYRAYRTSKAEGYYLLATFTHWLTILLPEPYRGLALANMDNVVKDELVDRKHVMCDAFQWSTSNEGYDFWYKVEGFINDDEDSLPKIPKVEDRYIPWTLKTVPIGNVLIKSDSNDFITTITAWYSDSVLIGGIFVKYEELVVGGLYSIDNGESWHPCGVKV